MSKIRLRYSKHGRIRFTSQRDMARMWERALRRSGLPLAWSEGFSPHPLLSFGLALPTGAESDAEYIDITLREAPSDPSRLPEMLTDLLPEGICVEAAVLIENDVGSLQEEVASCVWELEVTGVTALELADRVERLLASPSVMVRRERKGRTVHDDLRPSVLALAVSNGVGLHATVATRPRGIRPGELLEAMGPGLTLTRAKRTQQLIDRDGTWIEPLTSGGGLPENVGVCATAAP